MADALAQNADVVVSSGATQSNRARMTAAAACAVGLDCVLRFIGEGYGIPSAECLEAIQLLARSEATLLDPCYTGKGMAGLIHDVRTRAIPPEEAIMFLHTGGAPALFSQQDPAALVR
jgi:1-aminocyclopropane-1-carboxylate deaminase/D-cysteine desulfhydrase-like pyridoxal-dependent ACC family enzyme